MPDIQTAVPAAPAGPPPALHPMDPRRGEHLSPLFAAFLAWLLDLEPMTDPAIAGICIAGNSVLAATTDNPLFDAHLGSLADFEPMTDAICAAGARRAAPSPAMVAGLVARLRRAGR